jgi:hypothetical protein
LIFLTQHPCLETGPLGAVPGRPCFHAEEFDLKVGFISITEAIDLATLTGRALTGMLSVFAEFERDILRERIKAGIDQS